MFRGINSVNLDAKGRMALPSKHRENLLSSGDDRLVITIDADERCLLLYAVPEWEKVQTWLESLSNMKRNNRTMQRLLIGHATDVELDANGRLLIPPMLREYARLEKKLVLLGQSNKLEIWSEEQWQQRLDAWHDERSGDMADDDDYAGLSV